MFVKMKYLLFVGSFLFLFQISAHAIRDFGHETVIKSTKCFFDGTYTPNKNYDVEAYLKDVSIQVVKPSVIKVRVLPNKLDTGAFIGMSFYDPKDKEHKPIEDLSTTGTDEEVEESSFVQFKSFPGRGNQVLLSPVVYKKGYRGTSPTGKDIFANPFGEEYSITDEKGNELGGEPNFFTKMMVKVAGKGSYLAENTGKYITPDKQGGYSFLIKLNPKFAKKIFFIVGITKISIFPSGRGLRSPIITSPIDIGSPCR